MRTKNWAALLVALRFCKLVLSLPEEQRSPLLETTLEVAQTISKSFGGDDMLRNLMPVLPERMLPQALEAAQAITGEGSRDRILALLIPRLAVFPRKALYLLWRQVLYRSARCTRPHFLTDLTAFVPVLSTLGGPEVLVLVAAAIQMVSQWWP